METRFDLEAPPLPGLQETNSLTGAVDQVCLEVVFADSKVLDALVELLGRLRRVDPMDQPEDLQEHDKLTSTEPNLVG